MMNGCPNKLLQPSGLERTKLHLHVVSVVDLPNSVVECSTFRDCDGHLAIVAALGMGWTGAPQGNR